MHHAPLCKIVTQHKQNTTLEHWIHCGHSALLFLFSTLFYFVYSTTFYLYLPLYSAVVFHYILLHILYSSVVFPRVLPVSCFEELWLVTRLVCFCILLFVAISFVAIGCLEHLCVCVCVSERERERQNEWVCVWGFVGAQWFMHPRQWLRRLLQTSN